MKKIFKLLISVTLISALLSVCALADNSVAIDTATENNKLVNVSFNVTGLTSNDDVTILVFKKATLDAEPNEDNIVYLNQISASNNNISFNLLPDAADGIYEVRMGGTGVSQVSTKQFSITSIVYGDVNKDGIVNSLDGIYILRFLSGVDLSDEDLDINRADVNADDKVDSLDGIYILRFLSGVDLSDEGLRLPTNSN